MLVTRIGVLLRGQRIAVLATVGDVTEEKFSFRNLLQAILPSDPEKTCGLLRLHSSILSIVCSANWFGNTFMHACTPWKKRIALIGFFTVAFGSLASAEEGSMQVFLDQAKILKLDRPVSKVIVGNSKIADATVADPQTIVLTGKSFGATNLVLLDADGNALLDERVMVSVDEHNTMRVYRQVTRSLLSCTPSCETYTITTDSSTN